jgi:nicotinamide-nucleotide amidase
MIKAAIIAIGDELLIGETINTNSAWLGKELTTLGITINSSVTISDDLDTIISSLSELAKLNDIIITTGGLGPTKDDITKKALATYFDVELKEDPNTKSQLIDYFRRRNRELTDIHLEQALLPSLSNALSNSVGTAPGIFTKQKNKLYFNLPGVPREMKSIFEENIVGIVNDYKSELKEDYFVYKTIYTTGIVESEIAKRISYLDDENESIKFAYLPSYSGVRLRLGVLNSELTSIRNLINDLELKIRQHLHSHIIEEEKPILAAFQEYLIKNDWTISVAESCTGGGLGSLLTENSGSSKIFTGGFIVYSNKAKQDLLDVKQSTLDKFGAVSKETAIELANNCRVKLNTDYAISITGVAGPNGGSEEKPVGTVWIGISDMKSTKAIKFVFLKNREANRELSKYTALSLLYRKLKYNIDI